MTERPQPSRNLCADCGAKCCRYVAIEIDRPTGKRDYDHIRWYLLHEGIHVFVDEEGGWYVEFRAPCTALQPSHACAIYEDRPRICRRHGNTEADCEHVADGSPFREYFTSAEQFERWLTRRRVDWRWKKP